jgi:hypothetical protein
VFLRGGLGNQLFQYALALRISRLESRKLVIREDLLPEVEDSISGVSRWPNQLLNFAHQGDILFKSHQPPSATNFFGKCMQIQRLIGDALPYILKKLRLYAAESSKFTEASIPHKGLKSINGYASSKRFAVSERNLLVGQINQIQNPSPEFLILDKQIKKIRPTVVHLRMGDYVPLSEIYGTISVNFLSEGLRILDATETNPVWIFTQNQSEISAEVLATLNPAKIIDSQSLCSPLENMLLMSRGAGMICSNSTLSWWAAFLKNGEGAVIAPNYIGKTNVFTPEMTIESWRLLDVA